MAESSSAPIQIKDPEDWQLLIDSERTTVVDPMVYRAGTITLSTAGAG